MTAAGIGAIALFLANPLQGDGAVAAQSAASATAMAPAPASASTVASWRAFRKPTDAELKRKLTRIQYSVTQHEDTEVPFTGATWNNHEAGIYVDIVSGEPLFSSLDKYDSGTGWPSFTRPLVPANIKSLTDRMYGVERTEIRSKLADSHLGHVFDDGPRPTGLRYCMNSASMRFIPVSRLAAEGYGEFAAQFTTAAPKAAPKK